MTRARLQSVWVVVLVMCAGGVLINNALAQDATQSVAWKAHFDAGAKAVRQAQFTYARTELAAALAIAETFGPGDLRRAQTLAELGRLEHALAQEAKAQELLEKALATAQSARGKAADLVIADIFEALSSVYRTQSALDKAEEAARLALQIRKAAGQEDASVASAMNALAEAHHADGRLDEAIPLYKDALEIAQEAPARDNALVGRLLSNLAAAYRLKGSMGIALPLCNRALAVREQALGTNHPDIAVTLQNLGAIQFHQGRYAEAEKALRRGLVIRETLFPADHPDVETILQDLATVCEKRKNPAGAVELYRRVLALQEKRLGPDDLQLTPNLSRLGAACAEGGNLEEAQMHFERALEIARADLGEDHRDLAFFMGNLGLCYAMQKKTVQADDMLKKALAIARKGFGENHPAVADVLEKIAAFRYAQGNFYECYRLRERVSKIRNAQPTPQEGAPQTP